MTNRIELVNFLEILWREALSVEWSGGSFGIELISKLGAFYFILYEGNEIYARPASLFI